MTQENKSITARDEGIALINPDLLLTLLVQMVDKKPPFDIGITLFVQGSIVTGLLIGEDVYFEGLSNDMPDSFTEDFQKLFTLIQSWDTNSPGNQEEQNQLRNIEFIHLKNAKFFLGNSLVPNNKGTYWRGRLSRVDGFSLGQLSSNN
jgi:hypothetical protein